MKVQGTYTFEAPIDTVWNALFDPEVLAKTLPGCDKLEREGNQFKGDINVKMGPVQGKFQGKVDITDIKEHESYTMIVDGRGPAGFGKATALLRVQSEGSGTRLDYDSDVQVGGKIASVGQRLLDASSRAIVKQSLEGLHEQIKALAATRPAPAAASPALVSPALEPNGAAPPEPKDAPAAPADASGGSAVAPANATSATAPAAAAPAPPAETRPAIASPAGARGPSQAAFAFGVAKEVTKELFPMRTVLVVVALAVVLWLILRAV